MFTRCLILAVCLAVTGFVCLYSPAIRAGDASGVVMELPGTLAGFISTLAEPDEVERRELPEDTLFAKRDYFTPTSDPARKDLVHCSIVLSGAERKSIHRPEKCLVAQGWTLIHSEVIPITIAPGYELKVMNLYIERKVLLPDGAMRPLRAHYLYWFIGADASTPSHLQRTLISLMDSITRNVNHRWAYASVMALVTDNFTPEQVGQRTRDSKTTLDLACRVIQGTVPVFQKSFMADAPFGNR